MKKTYRELTSEINEALGISARKALGRRLKMTNKKASTKFKKARNKLKPLMKADAMKKAAKAVRKFVMQKIAGKGKDMSDLGIAQKMRLEKQADKKMKGGKFKALQKKLMKKIMKKHKDGMLAAKEKKASGEK